MDYIEDFELFPSPNVDRIRINILSRNLVSSQILLGCIEEASSHPHYGLGMDVIHWACGIDFLNAVPSHLIRKLVGRCLYTTFAYLAMQHEFGIAYHAASGSYTATKKILKRSYFSELKLSTDPDLRILQPGNDLNGMSRHGDTMFSELWTDGKGKSEFADKASAGRDQRELDDGEQVPGIMPRPHLNDDTYTLGYVCNSNAALQMLVDPIFKMWLKTHAHYHPEDQKLVNSGLGKESTARFKQLLNFPDRPGAFLNREDITMNTFNALGTPMRPLQYVEWNWDHDGSMDFNLEGYEDTTKGREDTTAAVNDTLAYGPYKGLTLVQLQSVQKEIQKRTKEQRVEHAEELQKLREHGEEQRVVHAKELQKELQRRSEEQRVEYAEELQKYKGEQQVEQTKEVQRKLQKHIDKHQAKHFRELQAKEQGIANRLQRAVDIQVEATTILRTILHVDVTNEIFTQPRIDPHLDEWDATNTN
jgi:hypothetical protein